ncbi:MAG: c-type cytochrome [Bacteroidia bacterium]
MKKILKITGIVIGILILIVAVFTAYSTWKFNHLPPLPVTPLAIRAVSDSATIAEGKKIVLSVCGYCHMNENGTLSGNLFATREEGFGEIWAANITRNKLDKYTDGELAFTIRKGVNREGRLLGPFMMHPNLSDQDVTAIISFLRSDHPATQPADFTPPAPDYSLLAKVFIGGLGFFQPMDDSIQPWPHPDPSDPVSHGRYLANVRLGCFGCHSASFETNDIVKPENSVNYMGGGNPVHTQDRSAYVISPNITPHPTDGIGKWSEEQFSQALIAGVRPGKPPINPAMPRFNFLSEEEIHALWSYLKTVPPLEGKGSK